ncbi:alanine racemase [Rathayibacter toxicus]|uniref:Alanine racemase n=1 Tax=Rathayibacter toxicus TaxID=145458 RepID=A0A2S5Y8V7_9MICO|nr:alanine racemase [Rathayibacter toxicus]PPH24901.1 alanine racemase [Rathayibacter toxicus]PPH58826.1 alanine racemase [Rathayibacter toxicus]PPH60821.1 alanine racemase [Rathayibacter toxicus]PPH88641.1 alanine racemase [Rathayibacter toxicus]PPI16333.1 alanine racemase [Rathayibacter toxicus]
MTSPLSYREAVIDADALAANVARLRERTSARRLMAVVKADGYGHGALTAARAALAGGANAVGTAELREAVALREAGVRAPLLSWLHDPGDDFAAAVEYGIEVGVSSVAQLDALAQAAKLRGTRADVQVKLDTGLSRNGVSEAEWAVLAAALARYSTLGVLRCTGVFSHVSNASREEDLAQLAALRRGEAIFRQQGVVVPLVHLAATAAALRIPQTRLDQVRCGIGIYGLSPFEDETSFALGLVPVMTLQGRVAAVRRVGAGTGVSYDYSYRADSETTLALVPLGYADGIPRSASGVGEVLIRGRRRRIVGRVAMDQFVVEVGDDCVAVGDQVTLWGDPTTGAPAVDDWARWCGTINYELVTRVGPRVKRRVLGGGGGHA